MLSVGGAMHAWRARPHAVSSAPALITRRGMPAALLLRLASVRSRAAPRRETRRTRLRLLAETTAMPINGLQPDFFSKQG